MRLFLKDSLTVAGLKLPSSSLSASNFILIWSSSLNSNDNTSETVSISKSMKILMLMPSALAIFKSWSGFGLRIPYSYFFIVAEFMPDRAADKAV